MTNGDRWGPLRVHFHHVKLHEGQANEARCEKWRQCAAKNQDSLYSWAGQVDIPDACSSAEFRYPIYMQFAVDYCHLVIIL